MEGNNSQGNSGNDIRINTKINVYGPVIMVSSISIASVGFLFLGIWMHSYWSQAIALSAFIVYGLVTLFFLGVLTCIGAGIVQFIIKPVRKSKILHTQENAIVYINGQGLIDAYFPSGGMSASSMVVESDASPSPLAIAQPGREEPVNEGAIVDMYSRGLLQSTIAESVNCSQATVSRILKKHKDKGEIK
jgi:hypothetical protein